jgi:peptidoglycan hydrolase-like protein with peptidoglycan-binding domain
MKHARIYQYPGRINLSPGERGPDVELLQKYLQRFGYLHIPELREEFLAVRAAADAPFAVFGVFDDATEQALKNYQGFFGLPATGVLDTPTSETMSRPRCGFPDLPTTHAMAEYAAQGNRWLKTDLTYGFAEFSADLEPVQVRTAIAEALRIWSDVTTLTFTEVPVGSNPDFVIRFATGDHGDGSSFDGVGRVLAHAFFPPPNGGAIAGDAHFDEAETWTVDLPVPTGGVDLVTVAAHEFGHSLGLAHSSIPGALMFPSYAGAMRRLAQDDIDGIRSLYPWGWKPVYQDEGRGGIGGYDLRSWADQMVAFDYDSSGKADHLVLYRPGTGTISILKQDEGTFRPVYAQGDPGNGIGGYNLRSPVDRAFAFDYDSSGQADHLVLYRPGTGAVSILRNVSGGFRAVYSQADPGAGIGGYDLRSPADRMLAFDHDGSGKADHLVLYRPGAGLLQILKLSGGRFQAVHVSANGIGGFDLRSPVDQMLAFDHDSSGKLDHLVLYRSGTGAIRIVKKSGRSFEPVYARGEGDVVKGIGLFDLGSPADRIFAFDYESSGKLDHLVLYRPGAGAIHIVKGAAGTFQTVYAQGDPGTGIGGYDLKSITDVGMAFDFNGTGKQDHLVFYRPGTGIVWVLEREL